MVDSNARFAGIVLPAFSPRRKGDLGIGDTLALLEWIDWAADHSLGMIQLLPIHENGRDESPYSAISSAAIDPIYLAFDPPHVPCLTAHDIAQAQLKLANLTDSNKVNYPAVRKVKRDLLELAWSSWQLVKQPFEAEFAAFCQKQADWLGDYTLFRYLMELHGEDLRWDQWPANCQTPEHARATIAAIRLRDPAGIDYRLQFFAFVQWICHRQWNEVKNHARLRGVRLMGDLPIGISWHSCDVFFHQQEFYLEWFGGSPAEGSHGANSFLEQWGQNWGIPLYRWDAMQANDYQWWRQRIGKLTEIFDIFRLDHILGFYRIYAFPWHPSRNDEVLGKCHDEVASLCGGHLPRWFLRPDDTDENKAANRADGDERLKAVRDAANGAIMIAEDLGWVPDYVRPHLTELGIAGFRIPHWDCNDHGDPLPGAEFPFESFASYSTHDHDPVHAIWRSCVDVIRRKERDPDQVPDWWIDGAHRTLRILARFSNIPIPAHGAWHDFSETMHLRLLRALLDSNSRYVAFMVTEIFAIDGRINHPGTMGQENWTYRVPWTMDEVRNRSHLATLSRMLSNLIHLTGRA
ncbi:MAG: hypothetical protein EAZ42_07120 [Verrucomicrobia bacterium]|nr:MAG: hypothetical protein EAZ42_07120 [Verrucomicrobiota bacterium]